MGKLTPTFKETSGANVPDVHVISGSSSWTPANLLSTHDLSVVKKPESPPAKPEIPVVRQPLRVALIGTAPSSRMLAPYNDPAWRIWGCSPGNRDIPRADVWFELHGTLLWPENAHYGVPYIEWLKGLKIPVYMQDQRYLPNAITYPKDEMIKEFGPDFFSSSFAWMMAFAIHQMQPGDEIALYGIDMASRDEYILQRPGFYYFRREAQKRGIIVSAPNESDIMQSPALYGYSDVTPFGRKIWAREKELKDRVAAMEQQTQAQIDNLKNNLNYLKGALEDVDYFKNIWMGRGG